MSLDQNLFTLNIVPSETEPDATDLVEPNGTVHYRKRRVPAGEQYTWSLYDSHSDGLLSTVTAPAATSKLKTVALHNPDAIVELKYTGTLSFKWSFVWEEHTFEWRREACYMIRKPDPPVQVAVTKEPSGRIKTSVVQILDYNLHRFDINDRKGLEIVMLSSLLTFTDSSEEYHARSTGQTPMPSPPVASSATANPAASAAPPPAVPPKSVRDRIVMAQAAQDLSPNEIVVTDEVDVNEYANYGCDLLQDNNLLYVVFRSGGPEEVPKVLAVAEAIKRLRHKAGIEQDLHLYPSYDEAPRKGPKIIRLDDPTTGAANYKPPMNLTIHLSKIPMPELQPKPKKSGKHPSPPRNVTRRRSNEDPWARDPWGAAPGPSKHKDGYHSDVPPPKGKDDKKQAKEDKKQAKEDKKAGKRHEKQSASVSAPAPHQQGKLAKPTPPPPAPVFPPAQAGLGYAPGPHPYPGAPPALNVHPAQAAYPPYMGRPQYLSPTSAGGNGQAQSSRPLGLFDRFRR
ncbi:hypothetical protein AURDEDRAFT_101921 [Auricularia subglabra TFB-10046 SS5]|nr:hypothetical protein AURDEDRAFT_101921 [Auricularia subglabra TFB-10046 SS5]